MLSIVLGQTRGAAMIIFGLPVVDHVGVYMFALIYSLSVYFSRLISGIWVIGKSNTARYRLFLGLNPASTTQGGYAVRQ